MSTVTRLPQPGDINGVVASEIRALLGRYGATQRDLAALIGVSQSQFSKRIRGAIAFDVVELDAIAGYFGVTVADLVGGRGRPGGPTGGGTTPISPDDGGAVTVLSRASLRLLKAA